MRNALKQVFGPEVASRANEYRCLNDEGKLKVAYKPNSHLNLRYLGGETALAKYLSRSVALQIKADSIGAPSEGYERKMV